VLKVAAVTEVAAVMEVAVVEWWIAVG